ncbi:MAG: polysaccharide biosynthesis C-terminal domain-containing protein [Oscillospiraceae bacterium]|nr:polysaccharide biosynthesis C-terminal domain-containing protein [Oscillospiraceae bacterium]
MQRKLPIFYSAILLTGVNLLLRLVSTSFQVYLSSRIGAAGIGLLQLVLSVGALSITAGMAGIRTSTMYLTAEALGKKKPGVIRWILSDCFLYSIVCSGAVATALYFLAPYIAKVWLGEPNTVSAIQLYSFFVPVYCLCGVMTGFFTAAGRIGTLAAIEVAEQLLCMTATISALTFWAGSDPVKACQSVIFGNGIGICMTLLSLVLLRLRERAPVSPRESTAGALLHTAVPLALADDLKAGISTAENIMVPKRLALYPGAAKPLAAFGTVCGMVFPVLMFPAAILFGLAELLLPELARCNAAGSKTRIRYLVKRTLKAAFLYGCLFGGAELLLADALCHKLYPGTDAGSYLKLYAIMIPMLYCDALTDAMTKGLGQQKACVRYNILTSAMDVALLFLLLPRYGMTGYFFSFLVTHAINFLLSFNRLMKITGKLLAVCPGVKAVAATVFSILAAGFVSIPVLRLFAFLVIWGSLLFLMQVLKKEDISWIKGLIKSQKTQKL